MDVASNAMRQSIGNSPDIFDTSSNSLICYKVLRKCEQSRHAISRWKSVL